MSRFSLRLQGCLLGLSLAAQAGAAELDLDQAESLILAGEADRALAMLQPHAERHAGDADFDYLFGLAALQAGQPALATLAFERVLAVDPNFFGARLDMARAYYELGTLDLARREFQELMSLEPPPEARRAIDDYLSAIEDREQGKDTQVSAYIEAAAGIDTNVNNATAQSSLFVPALGGSLSLSATSTKTRDEYISGAFGVAVNHDYGQGVSSFVRIDADQRLYSEQSRFDDGEMDLRVGAALKRDKDSFRLTYHHGRMKLAASDYRNQNALIVDWSRDLDARNQAVAFVSHNQIRYQDTTNKANNSNLSIIGGGWVHALDVEARSIVSLSAFAGRDLATDDRVDGDKDLVGLSLAGQHRYDPQTDLYASATYQWGDYDTSNPLFLTTRRDRQLDLRLGLNWRFFPQWSLRPELNFTRARSTIDIYEYDRTELNVAVRRQFQ